MIHSRTESTASIVIFIYWNASHYAIPDISGDEEYLSAHARARVCVCVSMCVYVCACEYVCMCVGGTHDTYTVHTNID